MTATDEPTDTEAEAALLALAESLEWFRLDIEGWEMFGARVGSARYGYGRMSGKESFLAAYVPDVAHLEDSVRREYPTLAAAKAACEYHHATGKWEKEQ